MEDNTPMERTAYMVWLLDQSTNENDIARLLFSECFVHQQREAFDILEAIGEEEFSWPDSFVKAAQIVIKSE